MLLFSRTWAQDKPDTNHVCGCIRLLLLVCLRYTNHCWVRKHVNIIMKPTNSPTQGQPSPRKKVGLRPHFGSLFHHSKSFSRGLGLVLCRKQTTKNPTQPNSPQTPWKKKKKNRAPFFVVYCPFRTLVQQPKMWSHQRSRLSDLQHEKRLLVVLSCWECVTQLLAGQDTRH